MERDVLKKEPRPSSRTTCEIRVDPNGEGQLSLTKLCRWLGVTPSGFYAFAREDRRLKVLVQASFAESKQRYGSPSVFTI